MDSIWLFQANISTPNVYLVGPSVATGTLYCDIPGYLDVLSEVVVFPILSQLPHSCHCLLWDQKAVAWVVHLDKRPWWKDGLEYYLVGLCIYHRSFDQVLFTIFFVGFHHNIKSEERTFPGQPAKKYLVFIYNNNCFPRDIFLSFSSFFSNSLFPNNSCAFILKRRPQATRAVPRMLFNLVRVATSAVTEIRKLIIAL